MVREAAEPADQRLADMMAYIAPNAIPQGYQPAGGGEVLSALDPLLRGNGLWQPHPG